MSRFELVSLGAGAIGSIPGAHLARSGRPVAMIVREQRALQIRHDGLRIKGLAQISTPVITLTDPSLPRGADVLIVAIKTPGTAAALEKFSCAEIGTVFSIQNGVLKNELISGQFGQERVLGALADTSGEMLPDGEMLFIRNVNILLGELSGEAGPRARHIAAVINSSGVHATAVAAIVAPSSPSSSHGPASRSCP